MAARRKRRTIAEIESGPYHPPPAELLRAIAENPVPPDKFDPDEVIWTGGQRRLDLNAFVHGDLGARPALDQILVAIIEGRPAIDVGRRGGKPKQKDIIQYRLEQARRFLVGRPPPRGQVPKEYEAALDRVARRYFLAAMGGSDKGVTLRHLLVSEVTTPEQRSTLDHKQIDNVIRGHLREFKKHTDRLLVKASAQGLPEVTERASKIERVIGLLKELDIIPEGPCENI
jgi:hypothetical protein